MAIAEPTPWVPWTSFAQIPPCLDMAGHRFSANAFGVVCERCGLRR